MSPLKTTELNSSELGMLGEATEEKCDDKRWRVLNSSFNSPGLFSDPRDNSLLEKSNNRYSHHKTN